jgi:hypothetical protein
MDRSGVQTQKQCMMVAMQAVNDVCGKAVVSARCLWMHPSGAAPRTCPSRTEGLARKWQWRTRIALYLLVVPCCELGQSGLVCGLELCATHPSTALSCARWKVACTTDTVAV